MTIPSKRKSRYVTEKKLHGLRVRLFPDDALEVKCEMGGSAFKCVLEKHRRIRPIKMPFAIAWAVGQDIDTASLGKALGRLPKRLKAYVLRRQQVDDTERKHASHLVGGKVHTAGDCTFVRVDLKLTATGHPGVLRLEVWYGTFSVHPVRIIVRSKGSPEFMDIVADRVEDIRDLLESSLLDEACSVLCS